MIREWSSAMEAKVVVVRGIDDHGVERDYMLFLSADGKAFVAPAEGWLSQLSEMEAKQLHNLFPPGPLFTSSIRTMTQEDVNNMK